MSDWVPVLSKKEAKHAKAVQRVIEKYTDALSKSTIDFTSLVGTDGYPKPVDMQWPVVQKNVESYLLSEVYGSTNGCDLVPDELYNYPRVIQFLKEYPVPIYNIETEVYTDMGYVPGYKGRRPYVDSMHMEVLTFAAPNVPVIHQYSLNIHCVKLTNVAPQYEASYSPVPKSYECDWDSQTDVLVSLANLTNLNSQHSSSE